MVVVIVVGLVVAAIVATFAYLLLGWVGLMFAIIAIVGGGAVAWYGYVLYGKASDLMHEGEVVVKRVGVLAELLGQIRVPDSGELSTDRDDRVMPERRADAAAETLSSNGGRHRVDG